MTEATVSFPVWTPTLRSVLGFLSEAAAKTKEEAVVVPASVGANLVSASRADSNTQHVVQDPTVDEWDPTLFMSERPLTDQEVATLLSAAQAEFDLSDYSHLFDDED
jgi:hypothetical protein